MAVWTENCRLVRGTACSSSFLYTGERSTAIVDCTTIRDQANPQQHPNKGFPEEKLITRDLAGKRQATSYTTEVSWQNAFGQDSKLVLHQLCTFTWWRQAVHMRDSTGFVVSLYLSPWSNRSFWLVWWKLEIKPAANNWTGWRLFFPMQLIQYVSNHVGIHPDPSPYLSQASWRVRISNRHPFYPHILWKGISEVVYNGRRLGSHT